MEPLTDCGCYGKYDDLDSQKISDDLGDAQEELRKWWKQLDYRLMSNPQEAAKELLQVLTVADLYDVIVVEGLFPYLEGRLTSQGNRIDKTLEGRYYILMALLLGPNDDPFFIDAVQAMRSNWDGYPSPRGTGDY